MKSKSFGLMTIALACLMATSGARAQFVWRVTASPSTSNRTYNFNALSCSGNNCTVATMLGDKSMGVFAMFMRTTDGGQSWKLQDPGQAQGGPRLWLVDQIDSMNVIGAGDSGMVLRSSDAGATWERRDLPDSAIFQGGRIFDIHFSDSQTGIAIINGRGVWTTFDGGKSWKSVKTGPAFQVHSYGAGKFRTFGLGHGPISTTTDNWKSYTSTPLLFDSVSDTGYHMIFQSCAFGVGDTIIAYGTHTNGFGYGLAMRTLDGGNHWETPQIFDSITGPIGCMSSPDRDTIFAGGAGSNLMSIDHGRTWRVDTIIFDTAAVSIPTTGISVLPNGLALASFGRYGQTSGFLAIREPLKNRVESYEIIIYGTHLYPNPATVNLTVTSVDESRPIRLIDILGREVLRDALNAQGTATLDVSRLPRGIYTVMIDHFGKLVPVGKVAVVGN